MASAAEQLAASINFSAFAKASELKSRIWFTLGALVIYRLGTYIPIPGIDPAILQDLFSRNAGGILGMFDMFSGGALGRMTIFALNIMPYISASIIIQLLTAVSPTLETLKKEGESGRKIRSRRSGVVLPPGDGGDAHQRHCLSDVARRADHRARRRQWDLADHL